MNTTLWTLFLFIISVGSIVGSVFIYDLSAQQTYDIEGDCIVLERGRETRADCQTSQYTGERTCNYWYTNTYKVRIYEDTICAHRADDTFDGETEECYSSGCDAYEVGDKIPCFTNQDCDDVLLEGEDSGSGWIMFGGVCATIFGVCTCFLSAVCGRITWFICHCDQREKRWYVDICWDRKCRYDPDEYDLLDNGFYERKHNLKEWKKLKSVYKVDYVLGYYSRKYGLELYGNIGDILAEYIKKPKIVKKKRNRKDGRPLSKREQYLRKTDEYIHDVSY